MKIFPFKETSVEKGEKGEKIISKQMQALDSYLLLRAIDYSAKQHSNQRRKNAAATPYINHPIGVAWILMEEGGVTDIITLQAAILHDTVEDTDTTIKDIVNLFGDEVASVVAEVTDDRTLTSSERKRKQVETVSSKSDRAKLVKLADKLYNLRDLEENLPVGWSEQRKKDYYHWAGEVTNQIKGVNATLEAKLKTQLLKV